MLNGKRCYRQSYPKYTAKLDKRAQQDGIAANFIHSHDAAHLVATVADLSATHGVESVMVVHDSFAVHACNVEILRETLAAQFVALHSAPILDFLHLSVEGTEGLPEAPEIGTLDLGQVFAAKYLF